MIDAERVAAIDRDAELRLLERLLLEKERPIPPAPDARRSIDPRLSSVMRTIAEAMS